MSRFVLTAQLQLQAPSNTRQVVQQIQRQLQGGVNLDVQLQNAPAAQRQLTKINKQVSNLNTQGKNLSKNFGISIRRFASFTIASRAVSLFTNKLAGAVDEAIKFEREMVKIAQVTGKSVQSLDGLTKTISSLSTNLGVASSELVGTTRILAQAGIKANDLEVALAALAKTTLAPTFEDITKTAEGAVAILAQFGQGVGALEDQLGSINKVAGQFAVESGDLISAVRRFGGVFKSAGGELDELLGLFTSVRATTRESAESIATGLRTIFTRIQRPKTIEFLKQFGVELTDLEGKFVGPFEAVRQLSAAFAGLEEGDIRFVQVAEELGGFRQIGKVIPLIQQFTVAERARQAALEGRGSLDEDAAKAQQALAVQIQKVREEFFALIRGISETGTFQVLVKSTLALTSQLIKLADAFKPLLPILASFAAIKIGANIGNIARGIGAGILGRNQGGPIGFASGGVVPGTGNRDTVPAMLTPGEFVIRKSSVNKIGADTLQAMNSNRFAAGGTVKVKNPEQYAAFVLDANSGTDLATKPVSLSATANKAIERADRNLPQIKPLNKEEYAAVTGKQTSFRSYKNKDVKAEYKRRYGKEGNKTQLQIFSGEQKKLDADLGSVNSYKMVGPFPVLGIGSPSSVQSDMQREFSDAATTALKTGAEQISPFLEDQLNIAGPLNFNNDQFRLEDVLEGARSTIEGYLLEAVVGAVSGAKVGASTASGTGIRADFDLPGPITPEQKAKMLNLFDPDDDLSKISKGDVKRQRSTAASGDGALVNKIAKDLKKGDFSIVAALGGAVPKYAKGGAAPSDTVPALLTPGEFVINKKAAQSIGASNLNRMNKQGVVGFAKGGPVGGVQRLNKGGGVAGVASVLALGSLPAIMEQITGTSDNTKKSLSELEAQGFSATSALSKLVSIVTTTGVALAAFGVQLNAQNIKKFLGNFRLGKGGLGDKLGGFTRKGLRGGTQRRAGEGFLERFDGSFDRKRKSAISDVRSRGRTIAERRGRREFGESAADARQARVDNIRRQRAIGGKRTPTSLTGKLGTRLGGLAKKRGLVGGAARLAGGIAGRGAALGGVAGLGGAGAAVAAFAGPLAAGAAVVGLFSSALKAGFDIQGKYNKAVEEGNVAKAKEYAAINQLSGIEQGLVKIGFFGDTIQKYGNIIRGTTVEAEKNKAELAALAGRADRDKAENAKKASEALKDVEAGAISITQAFKGGALTKSISQAFEANEATRNVNFEQEQLKSTGGSAALRNTLTLGGLLGESAGEKNKRIDAENAARAEENQKRFNDAYNELLPAIRQQARASIGAGQSFEDFENIITDGGKKFQLTAEQAIQLEKEFINLKQAAIDNRIAFLSLNLGLDPLKRAQQGLSVEIGNLAAAAQGSFDPVANAANTLEAAVNGASISQEAFDQAMKVATDTMGDLGATQGQIDQAKNSITAFRAASDGSKDALKELQKNFKGSDASPEEIKEALLNEISSVGGLGPEASKLLKDSLRGLELSDDDIQAIIGGGDISGIVDKIRETGGESMGQLVALFDEYGNAQNELLKITEARIEKESQLVSAISAQEEAAKTLAEFTGKEFGAREKSSFAEQRFRVTSGGAGSSPAELRRDAIARGAETSAAGGRVVDGQFEQTTQEKQTQQENLRQDQATIQFTKEKLAIIREEINVMKNRLALEKEAAQSLLAGDVAGFAENINASIAQSAFRTGDSATLQALDGSAVAAGFEGLTDEEKRAAKPQLEALGLSSGLADAAAGTSPEIEALKAEGAAYAEALVAATDNTASYAQAQLTLVGDLQTAAEETIAKKQEEIAKIQESNEARDAEIERLKKQAEQERNANQERREQLSSGGGNLTNSQAFQDATRQNRGMWGAFFSNIGNVFGADENRVAYSRGGTVYASRGMFIPRGTDTVPAMLTPGEFVVNRAAVQRGNNLQILRSMNGGDTAPNGAPAAMSKGGSVGYYNQGGEVTAGMGDFINGMSQAISQLGGAFGTFSQSVQQLANMKLSVNLSPTRVDVNVIGPMLSELTEATKEVVLNAVVSEIQLNQLGQLERTV